MVFCLSVEKGSCGPACGCETSLDWVDVLGSTEVTMRSDGEPVVMQVARAVRGAKRAGSATTLETSAPSDHFGNRLAERAVGMVGGMVRTLKNELEFICQIQIPLESKTTARVFGHAATLLNLDTVACNGKVPFARWRRRGHHIGRCVFGERVWYRVGPLTDRTEAEDRVESGMFVGVLMTSTWYLLIANGEAITVRSIRREPVSERWDQQ